MSNTKSHERTNNHKKSTSRRTKKKKNKIKRNNTQQENLIFTRFNIQAFTLRQRYNNKHQPNGIQYYKFMNTKQT